MTNNKGAILVVDDNPVNLRLLMDYLEVTGFEVLAAENGEVMLELLHHVTPDIILLDVMMPGMDGFETCRCLKDDPKTKEIPVIFMTALSDTADKVRGFKIGAVDYITKPIQYEEVLARVETHLALQNMQKQLRHMNEKLLAANNALKTSNKELDSFAHMVAHDLNNPLGVVLGNSELLECELILPEKSKQSLNTITKAAYKMRNIIEALLLLAGVRKAEVILEQLDMAKIVTDAHQTLVNMIEEHQAQIDLPSDWPIVAGYALWIEEVWVNYLSNGIKYGGQPPHLQLGATVQADNTVQFWVQDNGPGLTPEEQAQLFVPFTRLTELRTDGHGLGLSIVQRIMQKLGGQVGVESEVGQGSRFSFTLPSRKEK